MRTISLLLNDFLNIFQTLSTFYRKVFKYLQWFSRKFRNVFPSVTTMMEKIGCSDRTIKRATAYFQKMGWICKVKRGYQSNVYYMNNELINLNLDDPNLFFHAECPVNVPAIVPVLNVLNIKKDISTSEGCDSRESNQKQAPVKRDIPYFLNMKGISLNDQQRLANTFSDAALMDAKNGCIAKVKKGVTIRSLIALMWNIASKFKV